MKDKIIFLKDILKIIISVLIIIMFFKSCARAEFTVADFKNALYNLGKNRGRTDEQIETWFGNLDITNIGGKDLTNYFYNENYDLYYVTQNTDSSNYIFIQTAGTTKTLTASNTENRYLECKYKVQISISMAQNQSETRFQTVIQNYSKQFVDPPRFYTKTFDVYTNSNNSAEIFHAAPYSYPSNFYVAGPYVDEVPEPPPEVPNIYWYPYNIPVNIGTKADYWFIGTGQVDKPISNYSFKLTYIEGNNEIEIENLRWQVISSRNEDNYISYFVGFSKDNIISDKYYKIYIIDDTTSEEYTNDLTRLIYNDINLVLQDSSNSGDIIYNFDEINQNINNITDAINNGTAIITTNQERLINAIESGEQEEEQRNKWWQQKVDRLITPSGEVIKEIVNDTIDNLEIDSGEILADRIILTMLSGEPRRF